MFHSCDRECRHYKDKDHPIKGHWVVGEWEFDRCPKADIDTSAYLWISAYQLFTQGILPDGAGWLHQTDKYITTMMWMSSMYSEHEREHGQKQDRHRVTPKR